MNKINFKSSVILILALSFIITTAIGIPMLNGFAEGVSGSYNPTISCTIANLNGSSLMAYANSSFTADDTYPRLVTNGSQIRARFWGYDTAGISYINIKLIKVPNYNQLASWRQPGYPDLMYDNNFSVQNNTTYEHVFNITTPGTYAVLATIATPDGRTNERVRFFLYGPGDVVGGDFNNRIQRPEGQAVFCTLYDLSGSGLSSTSLYVTKPGATAILSNTGLTVTQDPSFPSRYKVSGYANRSALQSIPGQYLPYLQVYTNNSATSNTIYIPPFN